MRSRNSTSEQAAEVTRRRLELLSAELAGLRAVPPGRPSQRPLQAPSDPPSRTDMEPGETTRHRDRSSSEPLAPGEWAAPGRHVRRPTGQAVRVAGWLHDRLPPSLQGRVQLGASHLTVVALLVVVALGAGAWYLLRADRGGAVVRTSSPAHPAGSPGALLVTPMGAVSAGPSPGPTPGPGVSLGADPGVGPATAAQLVVDVAGKVRHPGIVTLPAGARVVDALQAAGGVRRRVDLTSLNLARPLTDGEQILVGLPAPTGVAAPAASAAGADPSAPLVNLNTATESELESLPGVGPVTAGAILKWRSEHGPFTAVDQLLDVSGIGDATLAQIAPFVTL